MRQPVIGLFVFLAAIRIASAMSPVCSLRPPRLQVPRADIFTEQQEQWLGDAQAEMIEPRYTLLPEAESAYLNEIGKRLLDQLPPTHVHYTFRVFESPDLRAFSLAGGHIYISLKLIMDARSEDELAAMLAQEIGRVYIHHSASAVTLRLDKLMHVKTLGDREDVYDKFERMLNVPPNDFSQLSPDDQKHDELLADQVGLYAMIRANYAPEAFVTFLDRVNDNGGFTGNLFTDLFDLTPDISIRVREAHKTVNSLPGSCRRPRPVYRPGFKPFRDPLRGERIDPIVPATPRLPSIPLPPPMNPALENVVLSPDGKYVLAQDESQIHVMTTAPLKLRFSIDALDAEMAQFTPDSRYLVFNYNDLHIEKWDLVAGQPAGILDFVDYAGCVQTSLSPDGNVLACVSLNGDSVWLKLVDVSTDRMLYQNMHFFDHYDSLGNTNANLGFNPNFHALMRWTRDGRYFVAASGTVSMAYDLKQHQTVKLEKTLSDLSQERFAFVGSDKMVSTCDWGFKSGTPEDTYKMCYTRFPGGQPLGSFQLPRGWLAGVTAGESLLFGPIRSAAAVIVDPAKGKAHQEFKEETVDLVGNQVATEVQTGGLAVGQLEGELETIDLPVTPLAAVEASAFSLNGRYLAVSDRARGSEWDLSTGKRMALTSPFRAVAIDDGGKMQVQFIPHELKPSIDTSIDKRTHKYANGLTRATDPVQYGSIRVRRKPLGLGQSIDQNVDLEAYDALTEAHLWSTRFDFRVPQIVPADGDQLLFVMDRQSATGNAEVGRNRKKLIRTSDEPRELFDEQGTLIEIVSNRTGAVERAIVAPQLASTRREERTASLFGNLLAVYGNNNNSVIYRASDGARLLAFFGRALAGDDQLGMIAATNRPQELTVYDVADGRPLMSVTLDHIALAARFVPEQRQLLVLTATQHVYRLDLHSPAAKTKSKD
ncbi:MAG: M48 family metalloprotease [Terracidiphilus sp.]